MYELCDLCELSWSMAPPAIRLGGSMTRLAHAQGRAIVHARTTWLAGESRYKYYIMAERRPFGLRYSEREGGVSRYKRLYRDRRGRPGVAIQCATRLRYDTQRPATRRVAGACVAIQTLYLAEGPATRQRARTTRPATRLVRTATRLGSTTIRC